MDTQMEVDTTQTEVPVTSVNNKRKAETQGKKTKDDQHEVFEADISLKRVSAVVRCIQRAQNTSFVQKMGTAVSKLFWRGEGPLGFLALGKTSAGKSSTIEQVLGIGGMLPRAEGPSTMCVIHINIVQPKEIPKTYQLEFVKNRTTMDFAGRNEVLIELTKHFASYDETPNYDEVVKLKIASGDALQLSMFDAPGTRWEFSGSMGPMDITSQIDNCRPYCLVFTPYSRTDMQSDDTIVKLKDAWDGKMKDLKIVVVVTMMDQMNSSDENAVRRFEKALDKIASYFSNAASFHIALVQTLDPRYIDKPAEYSVHRSAENRTLAKLPISITGRPGMILGVGSLRDFMLGLYMKKYDHNAIAALKSEWVAELSKKQAELVSYSKETRACEKASEIFIGLSDNVSVQGAVEASCRDVICQGIVDIAKRKENDLVSNTLDQKGIFIGYSKPEIDNQDIEKAKKISSETLQELQFYTETIVARCGEIYEPFVQKSVEKYKTKCPHLYDLVVSKWRRFHDSVRSSLTDKINESLEEFSTLNNLKTEFLDRACFEIPKCAFMYPPKGSGTTVGKLVAQYLSALLGVWLIALMAKLCRCYFKEFASQMNTDLSKSEERWPAATKEVIIDLKKEISELEQSVDAFIDALQILKNV